MAAPVAVASWNPLIPVHDFRTPPFAAVVSHTGWAFVEGLAIPDCEPILNAESNMVMSRHEKRRQKRLQKSNERRKYAGLIAHRELFPWIVIEAANAPTPLVNAVKKAAAMVLDYHEQLIPGHFHDLFLEARKSGFEHVTTKLVRATNQGGSGVQDSVLEYCNYIGYLLQCILNALTPNIVDDYMPVHVLNVIYGEPNSQSILVTFKSLCSLPGPWGTVYFSSIRPTLAMEGTSRVLAFSIHAIQAICERTAGDWRTYDGSHGAFEFMDGCLYFEGRTTKMGQPGFTFYNYCNPQRFTGEYARQILPDIDPGKRYYYRVGYCPCVFEGEFAKAKTLLLPGMDGTPEACAVLRSSLPPAVKRQMSHDVTQHEYRKLTESRRFELLRWYHANGVSQVVTLDHPVMRHEVQSAAAIRRWEEARAQSRRVACRFAGVAAKLGFVPVADCKLD